MIFKKIELNSFRNYESLKISLSPTINIIYGFNGQGKTNLLESIYLLCITKSHRSFIDSTLIRDGSSNSSVKGLMNENNINYDLSIKINRTNKVISMDNKKVIKLSSYIDKMSIIIFYPDDLDLVKGGPSIRRRYLNLELSQLDNNYLNNLNEYNKLLKIRNEMLKQAKYDEKYYEIITSYLVDKGIEISVARYNFIELVNNEIGKIYSELSGFSGFNIIYKPSIDVKAKDVRNNYLEKLKKIASVEKKLGITMIGPHRDDFIFNLGEYDLKKYGSQGQQRLSVIALKLSEISIFNKMKKSSPILLLDDVFSELDDQKKNNLLKLIPNDIQTIITTTDLNNLDKNLIKTANLIEIADGKIKEVEV